MNDFVVKDSGVREEYASGMRRDTQKGKPDFALILEADLPYEEKLITRFATHMAKGAEKYGRRNWEKSDSQEELDRFKSSALRHAIQWFSGDVDEDHASAVLFNLMAAERVKYIMRVAND